MVLVDGRVKMVGRPNNRGEDEVLAIVDECGMKLRGEGRCINVQAGVGQRGRGQREAGQGNGVKDAGV